MCQNPPLPWRKPSGNTDTAILLASPGANIGRPISLYPHNKRYPSRSADLEKEWAAALHRTSTALPQKKISCLHSRARNVVPHPADESRKSATTSQTQRYRPHQCQRNTDYIHFLIPFTKHLPETSGRALVSYELMAANAGPRKLTPQPHRASPL